MRNIGFTATAVLALLGSTSATAQPARYVIRVWSFGFAPRPIHLAAGQAVTLVFVNESGSSHDFTAPGFFKHAMIDGDAAPDVEVELRPHQTRSITLVPRVGTYQAHCSHFLHKQMGMSDTIIVD